MTKKRFVSRNEFRYNFSQKHKNYVFGESENVYHSVGITHKEYTKNKKNMPLERNPQNGKSEKSYIRYGIITDNKKDYGPVLKNYKFSDSDFKNVRSKIRNYKKKNK